MGEPIRNPKPDGLERPKTYGADPGDAARLRAETMSQRAAFLDRCAIAAMQILLADSDYQRLDGRLNREDVAADAFDMAEAMAEEWDRR